MLLHNLDTNASRALRMCDPAHVIANAPPEFP
jgi:hypothetical protein